MSSKSIYGSDFQFKRLHFNDVSYNKFFDSSIILNDLVRLNFFDGTSQTTAYLGNSPTPINYTYNILSSTSLICSTGTANLQNNIIIFNSNTGYQGSLYFNDASNNPINSFNITFSNNFTSALIITLLNNMTAKPSYATSEFCYIINNANGVLTYGTINLLTNGNLTLNFNNIQITNTSSYTLYITSFKFN
jgi:hypothetical protein